MVRKKALGLRCPTCKTIVLRTDECFPFCSDRCRLIDLGGWLDERYRIAAEPTAGETSESSSSESEGERVS